MKSKNRKIIIGKNKHFSISVFVLLFFTVIFSMITIVFSDSLLATKEEQRKKIYGEWHGAVYCADEEIMQSISDNVMVENVGIMTVLGEFCDSNHNIVGAMGYWDDSLETMGNIDLLDGHFPFSEDEVALESAVLAELGYSFELGQEVELTLLKTNSDNEEIVEKVAFTLSGVVKNYSGNWKKKEGTQQLVSCFVYPSFEKEHPVKENHIFIKMYAKYAKYAEDLTTLCKNRLVLNEYTYLMYSNESTEQIDTVMLQTVFLLTGFAIIIMLVNNEIIRRQSDFVTLRILGATRGKIVSIFFCEKIGMLLIAVLFGTVTGILGARLISFILSQEDMEFVFYVNFVHIISAVAVNLFGVLIALIFGFIRLFQLPLRGKAEQQGRHPSGFARKIRSSKDIFRRFRLTDKAKQVLSILLSLAAVTLIFVMSYSCYETYKEYEEYKKNYPIDYSFGTVFVRPFSRESEATVDKIKKIYGISDAYTYSVSEYEEIELLKDFDEKYAKVVYGELQFRSIAGSITDYSDDFEYSASFIGISNNLWDIYRRYSDNLLFDSIGENEVILYLPDFYFLKDGSLEQADVYYGKESDIIEIISEQKVKIGDEIICRTKGIQNKLVVAGIIREFDEDMPFCYRFTRPFSILCNQEKYNEIIGSDDYSYIMLTQDNNAISYQTGVELSRINTVLSFSDYRFDKERYQQNITVQLILALILSTAGILMVVLARYGISSMSNGYELYRYNTLYRLGMEKGTIRKYFIWDVVTESFWGSFCGTLAGIIWLFIRATDRYLCIDYRAKNNFDLFLQIIRYYISCNYWFVIVAIFAVAFVVNTLLLFVNKQRIIQLIGKIN